MSVGDAGPVPEQRADDSPAEGVPPEELRAEAAATRAAVAASGVAATTEDPAEAEHAALNWAVSAAMRIHLQEHLGQVEQIVSDAGRRFARRQAWLRPTQGEARWPVAIAVLVAIGLQLEIPSDLAVHPAWLLPALEFALLVLLVAANPHRIVHDHKWIRVSSITLVALASVANAWSALQLIRGLVHGTEGSDAGQLLVVGGGIWLTNVIIFALWYWEFDRGGPVARTKGGVYPDFQFPQMQTPDLADDSWEPNFVDYLYLSFTNAMAFSPTDTLPLNRWAKMLMLSQSLVSLVTVALVIARAVNILK